MNLVFADSYYFFALLNRNEPQHHMAREFAEAFRGEIVSTAWILTELGDGLAKPSWRPAFVSLYDELLHNPRVRVVGYSDELLSAGVDLYRQRLDKSWSLTDCVSFCVMRQHGIREALTGDQDFEQAGFIALLK